MFIPNDEFMIINPHPPLSSFPIVISILFVIVEVSAIVKNKSYKTVSNFLVISLLVFSIATFTSGYFGFDYANALKQLPEEIADLHQSFAKIHLILLAICLLCYFLKNSYQLESKTFILTYFALLIILLFNIIYVGFLGGQLVFEHGVGVKNL